MYNTWIVCRLCLCVCVCLCVLTGVPSCRMGLYKAGKPWGRGGDSELWGQATWRAPLPATGLGQAPGTCISPVKGLRPGSWDNVLSAGGCPSPARPVSAQCPWAPTSEGHPRGPWKGLITPKCTEKLSLPQNIARWTEVPGISECYGKAANTKAVRRTKATRY